MIENILCTVHSFALLHRLISNCSYWAFSFRLHILSITRLWNLVWLMASTTWLMD